VSGKYFCDTGKRTVALRRLWWLSSVWDLRSSGILHGVVW
jgi:hypothetical protein